MLMNHPMVSPTQQHEVWQCCRSAVGPVDNVVGIAPRRRVVTPGEATLPVTDDHRSPHRRGYHGCTAAHVERLRTASGDDPAHRGVAGPPPHDLRVDRPNMIELAAPSSPPFERLEIDDHGDMGSFASDERTLGCVQPPPADLGECIDAPLGRGPSVFRVSAATIRVDAVAKGCEHGLAGLRVKVPVKAHHSQDRCRHSQAALLAAALGVLEPLLPIELMAPMRDGVLELARR